MRAIIDLTTRGLLRQTTARVLAPLGFIALLAAPLWGQVTASISGVVEDATGGAVSGAKVTVKSLETGASRVAVTNDSGNFSVLSLPLGAQEVRAEKPGFQPAVRTGVTLSVGKEAKVRLQLKLGEFVQLVTVSEEAAVVNTTNAPVAGLV